MIERFQFCPRCGHSMIDASAAGTDGVERPRRICSQGSCGYVQRTNPTPAIGALVEHDGEIILARNARWPQGWFALITGYLEAEEDPPAAVKREVKEELNLDVVEIHPIGNYIFEQKNEVMLCYHVIAKGDVTLSAELSEYRRYKPHALKPWPRATGFAVAEWMKSRGLPFEFVPFPGQEPRTS